MLCHFKLKGVNKHRQMLNTNNPKGISNSTLLKEFIKKKKKRPVVNVKKLFWRKSRFPQNYEIE